MRIATIEVIPFAIPIRRPKYLGLGSMARVDNVLVKIQNEQGVVGWGETAPWPVFADTVGAVTAAIQHHLAPVLLGEDPSRMEWLTAKMDATLAGHSSAKAALDMALFDLLGKSWDQPVHNLLGGMCRDRIPLSFSVANQDIDADLEEIDCLLAAGVRTFKVKIGVLDPHDDLERLKAIRDLVGADVTLRVDANQSLPSEHALRLLREMEEVGLDFIEQPLPHWDLEGTARLARALSTPVMVDESVFGLSDAMRVARQSAAHLVSIKLMKHGGLHASRRVIAVCAAANIANYAGAMSESGLGVAAALHLAAASDNVRYGSDFYQPFYLHTRELLVEPLKTVDGQVLVPKGAGLGVQLDMDIVRELALS